MKNPSQKKIREEFNSVLELKTYAENQVRKTEGTSEHAEAVKYQKLIESELTRLGAML